MNNNLQIILASASPRRQQFLRELGMDFEIQVADIDETPYPNEEPIALVSRLAESKAQAIGEKLALGKPALIIAADTIVALNHTTLGKPTDAAHAAQMLTALRAHPHQVHSGVSLLHTESDAQRTLVNSTTVIMRAYSDAEIAGYIESGDPFDKAGGYAIQHPTFAPVSQIEGCMSGVMGLPLADLREQLAHFGVAVNANICQICQGHTQFDCCQSAV